MNRLILEPHPDDSFLSLGGHLDTVWREETNTILTVYADEKRAAEAQAFAFAVEAYHVCLGLEETKMDGTPPHRDDIGPKNELMRFIRTESWDQILFPVGLQHPDHLRLAQFGHWLYESGEDLLGPIRSPDFLWYLDTPYQIKMKNREDVQAKLFDTVIQSIFYPGKRKWRFKGLFPSQGRFFHFNPFEEYRMPELVVSLLQP